MGANERHKVKAQTRRETRGSKDRMTRHGIDKK